uniref:Polyprotein n=1 Tax=Ceratobasidium endornavirus 1 TaxID=2768766 RepID=A0A7G9U7U1_9VIRU|nr:polyprotein [Ceratobasidium endornavirus 1]
MSVSGDDKIITTTVKSTIKDSDGKREYTTNVSKTVKVDGYARYEGVRTQKDHVLSNKERKQYKHMVLHLQSQAIKTASKNKRYADVGVGKNKETHVYHLNVSARVAMRALALVMHTDKAIGTDNLIRSLNDAFEDANAGDQSALAELAFKYQNWTNQSLATRESIASHYNKVNIKAPKSSGRFNMQNARRPKKNKRSSNVHVAAVTNTIIGNRYTHHNASMIGVVSELTKCGFIDFATRAYQYNVLSVATYQMSSMIHEQVAAPCTQTDHAHLERKPKIKKATPTNIKRTHKEVHPIKSDQAYIDHVKKQRATQACRASRILAASGNFKNATTQTITLLKEARAVYHNSNLMHKIRVARRSPKKGTSNNTRTLPYETLPRSRKSQYCLLRMTGYTKTRNPHDAQVASGKVHVRIGSRKNDPINHISYEPFLGSLEADYDWVTNSIICEGKIWYNYKFYSSDVTITKFTSLQSNIMVQDNVPLTMIPAAIAPTELEIEQGIDPTSDAALNHPLNGFANEHIGYQALPIAYTAPPPKLNGTQIEAYNTYQHEHNAKTIGSAHDRQAIDFAASLCNDTPSLLSSFNSTVQNIKLMSSFQGNQVTVTSEPHATNISIVNTENFNRFTGRSATKKSNKIAPSVYACMINSLIHGNHILDVVNGDVVEVNKRTPNTIRNIVKHITSMGAPTFLEYASQYEDANTCPNEANNMKCLGDRCHHGKGRWPHIKYDDNNGFKFQCLPGMTYNYRALPRYNAQIANRDIHPGGDDVLDLVLDPSSWWTCANCNGTVLYWGTTYDDHTFYQATRNEVLANTFCPHCHNRVFVKNSEVNPNLDGNVHAPFRGLVNPLHWIEEIYPGYTLSASSTAAPMIDDHDARLLRRLLSVGKPKVIYLPTEVSEINDIQSSFRTVSLVPRPGALHAFGGRATAELYAMVGTAMANLESTPHIVTVNVPISPSFEQMTHSHNCPAIVCLTNLHAKDGLVTAAINKAPVIYVITPSYEGELPKRQLGEFYLYAAANSDQPYVIAKGDSHGIETRNVISISGHYYINSTIKKGHYFLMNAFVRYDGNIKSLRVVDTDDNAVESFNIPVLEKHSIGNLLGYGWVTKEVKIHRRLLSVLVRRDLRGGDLSYDSMMEAAIGLAMNRYNLADRTVKLINVDAETLADHVMIATLMMRRFIDKHEQLVGLIRNDPSWRNISEQVVHAGANALIGTFLQRGNALEQYANQLTRFHDSAIISKVDAVLTDIRNWTDVIVMHDTKHHDMTFTPDFEIPTCNHLIGPVPQNATDWCKCCLNNSHTPTCSYCMPGQINITADLDDAEYAYLNEEAKAEMRKPYIKDMQKPKPGRTPLDEPPKPNKETASKAIPGTEREKTFGIRGLSASYHGHICYSCKQPYAHKARKSVGKTEVFKIGEEHFQYMGDCPWHEDGQYSIKLIESTPGIYMPITDMLDQGKDNKDDQMELVQLTSFEWADTLAKGTGTMWPTVLQATPLLKGTIKMGDVFKMSAEITYPFDINTCGRDAIRTLWPHLTIDKIAICVGKHDSYTQTDIESIAKELALDIVVNVENEYTFMHYGSGKKIGLLRLSSSTGIPHWHAHTCELVKTPDCHMSMLPDCTPAMLEAAHATLHKEKWSMNAPNTKRVITEIRLLKSSLAGKSTVTRPVYSEHEGGAFITNNTSGMHNLQAGLVHLAVPRDLRHIMPYINSTSRETMNVDALAASADIVDQIEGIYDERIKRVREQVKNIVDVFTTMQSSLVPSDMVTTVKNFTIVSPDKIRLTLPETYRWKALDVIYIRSGTGFTPVCINPYSVGAVYYCDLNMSAPVAGAMTIKYRSRISVSSAFRSLAGLMKVPPTMEEIKSTLNRSRGVLAPGGWGKTTEIVRNMDKDSLVICSTSTAQEVIKNGLLKGMIVGDERIDPKPELVEYVYSLEKAQYLDLPDKAKIIVDEAGMIRPYQLLTMIRPLSTYTFYGDDTQVGYIDFTNLGGQAATKSIFDYLPKHMITVHNTQYRVSHPLCAEIDKVRNGGYIYAGEYIETTDRDGNTISEPTRTTTFDMTDYSDWSDLAISNLIAVGKYDKILVFHNDDIRAVEQACRKAKLSVYPGMVNTVHRAQGGTWKRGLVLQHKYHSGFGVEVSPRHCMTAATRFLNHLSWVTIGIENYKGKDLPTRMGKLSAQTPGHGYISSGVRGIKRAFKSFKESDIYGDNLDQLLDVAKTNVEWRPKIAHSVNGYRNWSLYNAMIKKYESMYPCRVSITQSSGYDVITIKALGLKGVVHVFPEHVQIISDMAGQLTQTKITDAIQECSETSSTNSYVSFDGLVPNHVKTKHFMHLTTKTEFRLMHSATVAMQVAGSTFRVDVGGCTYLLATTTVREPLNLVFYNSECEYWVTNVTSEPTVVVSEDVTMDDSFVNWLNGGSYAYDIDHHEINALKWFRNWWQERYLEGKKIANMIKPIFDVDGPFVAENSLYSTDIQKSTYNDLSTDTDVTFNDSMMAVIDMLGMPLPSLTNGAKTVTMLVKNNKVFTVPIAASSVSLCNLIVYNHISYLKLSWTGMLLRNTAWAGLRPLQGKFMLDLSKHVAAGDRTGSILINAFGRELLTAVRHEPKSLVLYRLEDDKVGVNFRKEHQSQQVAYNVTTIPKQWSQINVNRAVMHSLQTCVPSLDVFDSDASGAIQMSIWHWRSHLTNTTCGNPEIMKLLEPNMWKALDGACNMMSTSEVKNVKEEAVKEAMDRTKALAKEAVTSKLMSSDGLITMQKRAESICYYPPYCLNQQPESVHETIVGNSIITFLPIPAASNWRDNGDGTTTIYDSQHHCTYNVPSWLTQLWHDKLMNVKTNEVTITTIGTSVGQLILHIHIRLPGDELRMVLQDGISDHLVTIQVPIINNNFMEDLTKGHMQVTKIKVRESLWRRITMRLLRPDTTLADLRTAIRMLLNNTEYMVTHQRAVETGLDSDQGALIALAAYCIYHQKLNTNRDYVIGLVENTETYLMRSLNHAKRTALGLIGTLLKIMGADKEPAAMAKILGDVLKQDTSMNPIFDVINNWDNLTPKHHVETIPIKMIGGKTLTTVVDRSRGFQHSGLSNLMFNYLRYGPTLYKRSKGDTHYPIAEGRPMAATPAQNAQLASNIGGNFSNTLLDQINARNYSELRDNLRGNVYSTQQMVYLEWLIRDLTLSEKRILKLLNDYKSTKISDNVIIMVNKLNTILQLSYNSGIGADSNWIRDLEWLTTKFSPSSPSSEAIYQRNHALIEQCSKTVNGATLLDDLSMYAAVSALMSLAKLTGQTPKTAKIWNNLSGMRVGLVSVGSYGDMLPFMNMAGVLAEQGALVTMHCPAEAENQFRRAGFLTKTGQWSLKDNLDLWDELTRAKLDVDKISKSLGTNWIQGLDLQDDQDLWISSPIAPQGIAAAICFSRPHFYLSPLPWQLQHGTPKTNVFSTLSDTGIIMMHSDHINNFMLSRKANKTVKDVLLAKQVMMYTIDTRLTTMISAYYQPISCGYLGWTNPINNKPIAKTGTLVSFGSMTQGKGLRLASLAIRALISTGHKVIHYSNEKYMTDEIKALVALKSVKMVKWTGDYYNNLGKGWTVVHHGGAGTTQSICYAGAKQLIMPVAYDQSYWASQIDGIYGLACYSEDPNEIEAKLIRLASTTFNKLDVTVDEINTNVETALSKAFEAIMPSVQILPVKYFHSDDNKSNDAILHKVGLPKIKTMPLLPERGTLTPGYYIGKNTQTLNVMFDPYAPGRRTDTCGYDVIAWASNNNMAEFEKAAKELGVKGDVYTENFPTLGCMVKANVCVITNNDIQYTVSDQRWPTIFVRAQSGHAVIVSPVPLVDVRFVDPLKADITGFAAAEHGEPCENGPNIKIDAGHEHKHMHTTNESLIRTMQVLLTMGRSAAIDNRAVANTVLEANAAAKVLEGVKRGIRGNDWASLARGNGMLPAYGLSRISSTSVDGVYDITGENVKPPQGMVLLHRRNGTIHANTVIEGQIEGENYTLLISTDTTPPNLVFNVRARLFVRQSDYKWSASDTAGYALRHDVQLVNALLSTATITTVPNDARVGTLYLYNVHNRWHHGEGEGRHPLNKVSMPVNSMVIVPGEKYDHDFIISLRTPQIVSPSLIKGIKGYTLDWFQQSSTRPYLDGYDPSLWHDFPVSYDDDVYQRIFMKTPAISFESRAFKTIKSWANNWAAQVTGEGFPLKPSAFDVINNINSFASDRKGYVKYIDTLVPMVSAESATTMSNVKHYHAMPSVQYMEQVTRAVYFKALKSGSHTFKVEVFDDTTGEYIESTLEQSIITLIERDDQTVDVKFRNDALLELIRSQLTGLQRPQWSYARVAGNPSVIKALRSGVSKYGRRGLTTINIGIGVPITTEAVEFGALTKMIRSAVLDLAQTDAANSSYDDLDYDADPAEYEPHMPAVDANKFSISDAIIYASAMSHFENHGWKETIDKYIDDLVSSALEIDMSRPEQKFTISVGNDPSYDVFVSMDGSVGQNCTIYFECDTNDEEVANSLYDKSMLLVRAYIVSEIGTGSIKSPRGLLRSIFYCGVNDSVPWLSDDEMCPGLDAELSTYILNKHMSMSPPIRSEVDAIQSEYKVLEVVDTDTMLISTEVMMSFNIKANIYIGETKNNDYNLDIRYDNSGKKETRTLTMSIDELLDILSSSTQIQCPNGVNFKLRLEDEMDLSLLRELLPEEANTLLVDDDVTSMMVAHFITSDKNSDGAELRGFEISDKSVHHDRTFTANDWPEEGRSNGLPYPEETNEFRNSDVDNMHGLNLTKVMARVNPNPIQPAHITAVMLASGILNIVNGYTRVSSNCAVHDKLTLEFLPMADTSKFNWIKPPTIFGKQRELDMWCLVPLTLNFSTPIHLYDGSSRIIPTPPSSFNKSISFTCPDVGYPMYLGNTVFNGVQLSRNNLLRAMNAGADIYGMADYFIMQQYMFAERVEKVTVLGNWPENARVVECKNCVVKVRAPPHAVASAPHVAIASNTGKKPGYALPTTRPWSTIDSDNYVLHAAFSVLTIRGVVVPRSNKLPLEDMSERLWFKRSGFLGAETNALGDLLGIEISKLTWRELIGRYTNGKLSCVSQQYVIESLDKIDEIITPSADGQVLLIPKIQGMVTMGFRGVLEDKLTSFGLPYMAEDGEPVDAIPPAKDVRTMGTTGMQISFENQPKKTMFAIGVPVAGWKTTLAQELPQIFADHDDYLDQEKHRKLFLDGNLDLLHAFQKQALVPKNKVLLTWGSENVPSSRVYLGSVMHHKSARELNLPVPEYRLELNEINRIGLFNENNYTLVNSYDEFKQKCLGLVEDALEGNLTVRENTIELGDLADITFSDIAIDGSYGEFSSKDIYLPYIPCLSHDVVQDIEPPEQEMTPLDFINLYEDNDLTDLVRVVAPMSEPFRKPVRSTEHAIRIIETAKTVMKKYPMRTRPVLTKLIYGELNASILRMESKEVLKKIQCDPEYEADRMAQLFFIKQKKFETISYNTAATLEWVKQHKGSEQLQKELRELLDQGFLEVPLNSVKVHQKLEALIKGFPKKAIGQLREQQVRIIVSMAIAVAAIFSPVFIKAKKNLKKLLRQDVLYADGLTPQELSAYVRNIEYDDDLVFVEDDGNKQDKRTEHDMLLTEMIVYKKYLGVAEHVVDLWYQAHNAWRYKGTWVRGVSDAMRQTGQATTAIGNVIVNLVVHTRLVESIGNDFVAMLVLGDDNLIISKSFIDPRAHEKDSRLRWNMVQECEQFTTHGTFLQMIVGKDGNGRLQASPDFIRLRNRFEVTNGVSNDPEATFEARCLSYCMMLGQNERGEKIIRKMGYDTKLTTYYNQVAAIENVAARHGVNRELVKNEINDLYTMMESGTMQTKTWTHFTGTSRF